MGELVGDPAPSVPFVGDTIRAGITAIDFGPAVQVPRVASTPLFASSMDLSRRQLLRCGRMRGLQRGF